MIPSLLIANRGEIACRIARTARRLGVRSIAVYSDADASAAHVAACDEAVRIGPAPAKESYLCIPALLDAARRGGAAAVHPGYGFLSENAGFAEAVAAAGLVFVGPPPSAIRAMGSKSAAKRLMEQAGVPLVPGYHGEDQDDELLTAEALRIGFPLLVKASAGGGGKGMRIVTTVEELAEALAGARREAKSAFGDDRLLLERYLPIARHVEVQVFADAMGSVLHLHERDCSLQRRHQKVMEEAPAPGLDPARRAEFGAAAVAAARAVGYVGAGTVEFIMDAAAGPAGGDFYFMEMNTRLQVEHPVTEMITGVDLVEWQLRVASGEKLPMAQEEIPLVGHAVEVRLYAEDAGRDFLPTGGKLLAFDLPPCDGYRLRVDAGVRAGDVVGTHYDPMLAKFISWGRSRQEAIANLAGALRETELLGVVTNLPFLRRALAHAELRAGPIDTGFLSRHAQTLLPAPPALTAELLATAALALLARRETEAAAARPGAGGDRWSPWAIPHGWRLNGTGSSVVAFTLPDGSAAPVELRFADGSGGAPSAAADESADADRMLACRIVLPAAVGGGSLDGTVSADPQAPHRLTVTVDGHRRRIVAALRDGPVGRELLLGLPEGLLVLPVRDPLRGEGRAAIGEDRVLAPMPGRIVAVKVVAGAAVKRGAPLVLLEAMKMEHTLTAPRDGIVEALGCAAGEQVTEGAELVRLAALAPAE